MSSPDDDVLISTAAAAILHDVKPATIRSWVRRKLLQPASRDDDGGMWFLIQDVDRAELLARQRDTNGNAQRRLA